MRTAIFALLALAAPVAARATPSCPAPEPIAVSGGASHDDGVTMPASVPATEIAASPALQRIASRGAVLYPLAAAHGMRAVFARQGNQFRVFYLTPDGQAEIGGVMWDASGHNVTREQVADIPGTIPTAHWNPSQAPSKSAGDGSPKAHEAAIDPVGRLAAAHFGLEGRDGAPRIYMVVDPLCPFSTRAFGALAPYAAAGKLQIAIVPISINDHENRGASTPAALQLLSASPQTMGDTWRRISMLGHAEPDKVPSVVAQASLPLNLAAAHAISMRGTPTLVWKDRNGASRQETGLPDNMEQFLASLPS